MRKLLPSQFDRPDTKNLKSADQSVPRPFLKIAGLDRVLTPDTICSIQGRMGDVRIQLSDGALLQVRKFAPEELVQGLAPYFASPFVLVRSHTASGVTVYLNSGTLTGYSNAGPMILVYFGTGQPVRLDGVFRAADIQTALEAVGHTFASIEPVPLIPIIRSRDAYEIPAYDIDRPDLNLGGRV